MSAKGLPGFLRRSLRTDFEEEDAEDRNSISSPSMDSQRQEQKQLGKSTQNQSNLEHEDKKQTNGEMIGRPTKAPVQKSDRMSSFSFGETDGMEGSSSIEANNGGAASNGIPQSTTVVGTSGTTEDGVSSSNDAMTATTTRGTSTLVEDSSTSRNSTSTTTGSSDENNGWSEQVPPKRTISYKETQFQKTITADVVKMSELRKLGWNGIPPQHRGTAWKVMLGYLPTNASRRQQTVERKRAEYKDAITQHYEIDDDSRTLQEQETLRQVLVDVPRTAPEIPLFRNERIRRALARLLYIWAMRHPASSYVQGINDLATPLIAVFLSDYYDGEDVLDGNVMVLLSDERLDEVEADCYWCLTNILAGIQDHYTADQPGVQRMVMRLEELVNRIDADLADHFRNVGIQFMQFAFKWMNCLLLREFNLRCVIRLWDTYISEDGGGFEGFHVYVCAAFLCQFSMQLQSMDFDELFGFMQQMPTNDWGDTEIEMLLSQAFVLSTLFGGSDAHLTSNHRP